MYDLLYRMQIPNLIVSLPTSPSVMMQFLYIATFLKFKLVDLYVYLQATDHSNQYVYTSLAIVFLLHLYEFSLVVSSKCTKLLTDSRYAAYTRPCQGALYLVYPFLFQHRLGWSMPTLSTYFILTVSANTYYMNNDNPDFEETLSFVNYVFYSVALHLYMVSRMWEKCKDEQMFYFSAYLHVICAIFRARVYRENAKDLATYATLAVAGMDLYMVRVTDDSASIELQGVLLVIAFLCQLFQCFGDFSPLFVQNIFHFHLMYGVVH